MSGIELWVIKPEDSFLLDCKSQTKEVAHSVGSGLVGSHMKGMLPCGPFAASHWPAQEGQSPQPVSPPRCQNIIKSF